MSAQETYISFMMDYAAGNQDPAFMLAGDIHVNLHTAGADTSRFWSMIGGAFLEAATLQTNPVRRPARRGIAQAEPISAAQVITLAGGDINWRRSLWGVQYSKLNMKGARLMRLMPGAAAPRHGHHGLEATVVLRGCLSDGHGEYERGDLVLGEPGIRHKPAAVGCEPCICFVAEETRWAW